MPTVQTGRRPREAIFEFKRRTLVHFALDTESVLMTTSRGSAATYFFPSKSVPPEQSETRPILRGRT